MTRVVVLIITIWATVARADEAGFRAAGELAANNDPRAIDAFEAVGVERPITRWTDDAWVEAARISELHRDYDRARRDLEHAIAISTDAQLVRRAKNDLARLAQLAGESGEWSAVAAEHQRLGTAIAAGGDPTRALEQLEVLARSNPAYPRGAALRITIARAWETEDEIERALGWLRDALALDTGDHARIELVRMLIRNRELAEARREVPLIRDATTRASLARALATGESRQVLRWIAIVLLAALGVLAAYLLRRRNASWRALIRPPAELLYFLPIGVVVAVFSTTGSPLVAKGVISIVVSAAVITWISGVTLEAARPVGMRHAVIHACVAGVAVLAAVYLALDHARLLDLVAETWRTGPGH